MHSLISSLIRIMVHALNGIFLYAVLQIYHFSRCIQENMFSGNNESYT